MSAVGQPSTDGIKKPRSDPSSILDGKLPPISVRVVEPNSHVRRTGPFRPDFIARIFKIDLVSFQMRQRPMQSGHIWKVKGHVIDYPRRRFALKERDGHIVVTDSDAMIEFELLF